MSIPRWFFCRTIVVATCWLPLLLLLMLCVCVIAGFSNLLLFLFFAVVFISFYSLHTIFHMNYDDEVYIVFDVDSVNTANRKCVYACVFVSLSPCMYVCMTKSVFCHSLLCTLYALLRWSVNSMLRLCFYMLPYISEMIFCKIELFF